MSDNIILTGFMGTGKDTVGQSLSRQLKKPFISTDKLIELKTGKSIKTLFSLYGEGYFRKLEKEMVSMLSCVTNSVIATGGGMVLDSDNQKQLRRLGRVIALSARPEIIKERLANDDSRPLIRQEQDIDRLFEQRKGIYDFAELSIDTSDKTLENIVQKLSAYLGCCPKKARVKKEIVNIKSQHKAYPVMIGTEIINDFFDQVVDRHNSQRVVMITNPLVGALYLEPVFRVLSDLGIKSQYFIIPDGEQYKKLDTVSSIYDYLLENNLTRFDTLIALGGGVIGDITGFVASTYKRGMHLIQIPTTLLAQIDAAIGGKTGINHKLGKNMIGTFYPPDYVVVDIDFLTSLSETEYKNGLAEAIKYALIKDAQLFEFLEAYREQILKRQPEVLFDLIVRCIKIKTIIVIEDEYELSGKRMLLNFGHTVGHILETLTTYRNYSHGEAVAFGISKEAAWAEKKGYLPADQLVRIQKLLIAYGFQLRLQEEITAQTIKDAIPQDKKVSGSYIKIPLLTGIGQARIEEVLCQDLLL